MLRILTYHRVSDLEHSITLNPRMISATPLGFEQQIRYVARSYHLVSMEQVLAAVANGARLPRRPMLITFDDAYCDFKEIAWPILQRYGVPVTLFVPTGYPDHPERSFWWDRLYRAFIASNKSTIDLGPLGNLSLASRTELVQSLKITQNHVKSKGHDEAMRLVDHICEQLGAQEQSQKSVLSWDELRELAKQGVTLGAHTVTHPLMTKVFPESARWEIEQSQRDLQQEIGKVLPIFCYPSGGHDDMVVDILRQEGFALAFTTLDGHNDLRRVDPLRLRRTNLTLRTTLPILRVRLTRLATAIDAWRHQGH